MKERKRSIFIESKKRREFIKFVLANGSCTVFNFVSYCLMYECLEMHYIIASVLSYILAMLTAYILNRKYVFRSKENTLKTLTSFVSLKVLMGLMGNLFLYFCVDFIGIDEKISWIVTMVVSFVISYMVSVMIFRNKEVKGKSKIRK